MPDLSSPAWSYSSMLCTPTDAATLYAAQHAIPGRVMTPGGRWDDGRFAGSFRIKGQPGEWAIRYEGGVWEIERKEGES